MNKQDFFFLTDWLSVNPQKRCCCPFSDIWRICFELHLSSARFLAFLLASHLCRPWNAASCLTITISLKTSDLLPLTCSRSCSAPSPAALPPNKWFDSLAQGLRTLSVLELMSSCSLVLHSSLYRQAVFGILGVPSLHLYLNYQVLHHCRTSGCSVLNLLLLNARRSKRFNYLAIGRLQTFSLSVSVRDASRPLNASTPTYFLKKITSAGWTSLTSGRRRGGDRC